MRKHRLYGVSLAMLATGGAVALSYTTLTHSGSDAAGSINPARAQALHTNHGKAEVGVTSSHLVGPHQHVQPSRQRQIAAYVVQLKRQQEINNLKRVIAFDQWITAAKQAEAQQAQEQESSSQSSSSSSGSDDASGWQRVADCEEGGSNNSTFGYYGITPSTWQAYGGGQYSSTAGGASQSEQLQIAQSIQSTPGDQDGCSSW